MRPGPTRPATSPATPPRSRRPASSSRRPHYQSRLKAAARCRSPKKRRPCRDRRLTSAGCEPRASAVQPTRRGQRTLAKTRPGTCGQLGLKSERHFGPAQDQIAIEKFEHGLLCARLITLHRGRSDDQVATVVKGDRKRRFRGCARGRQPRSRGCAPSSSARRSARPGPNRCAVAGEEIDVADPRPSRRRSRSCSCRSDCEIQINLTTAVAACSGRPSRRPARSRGTASNLRSRSAAGPRRHAASARLRSEKGRVAADASPRSQRRRRWRTRAASSPWLVSTLASQAALVRREELARGRELGSDGVGVARERRQFLVIALGLRLVAEAFGRLARRRRKR